MNRKRFLLIILLVTGIAVWYAYTEYNRSSPNLKEVKAAYSVTVPALLSQFEKDSAAANKQYTGKIVAVSGTVKKLEGESNPVIVFLGDAAQMSSVQCSMDSTDAAQYKTLQTGTTATLKGLVTGFRTDPLFGTDVILNRCVIAPSNDK
jgi:uncharacterized protein (DUF1330 family)